MDAFVVVTAKNTALEAPLLQQHQRDDTDENNSSPRLPWMARNCRRDNTTIGGVFREIAFRGGSVGACLR
jgi:hypothetical protein